MSEPPPVRRRARRARRVFKIRVGLNSIFFTFLIKLDYLIKLVCTNINMIVDVLDNTIWGI